MGIGLLLFLVSLRKFSNMIHSRLKVFYSDSFNLCLHHQPFSKLFTDECSIPSPISYKSTCSCKVGTFIQVLCFNILKMSINIHPHDFVLSKTNLKPQWSLTFPRTLLMMYLAQYVNIIHLTSRNTTRGEKKEKKVIRNYSLNITLLMKDVRDTLVLIFTRRRQTSVDCYQHR